jgi:Cu(I)/Ag(I) efflux system membrane fusion protein
MNMMKLAGGLALSLTLAACGEKQNNGLGNRHGSTAEPAASQAAGVYSGTGDVTTIAGDQVTISHGPIEGIGWPAMTMTFRAGSPEMVRAVKVGDRVSFSFRQDGSTYVLASLSKDR